MKCFHHLDLDGRSAASIVAEYYKDYDPAHYIEIDYGTEWDLDSIKKDEDVIIVDLSFQESSAWILRELCKKTKNLIWIDHHKTSVKLCEKYKELDSIYGIRNTSTSAAALTYMCFYLDESFRNTATGHAKLHSVGDVPYYIQLIADVDCGYHYIKYSEQFKYGMEKKKDLSPTSTVWHNLFIKADNIMDIIEEGTVVLDYINSFYLNMKNILSYESKYNGKRILIMNSFGDVKMFGNSLRDYYFCCRWYFDGTHYHYSIYTDDTVNALDIASQYDGGGHDHAAGFVTDELVDWCKRQ